jgi:hypothetical protein
MRSPFTEDFFKNVIGFATILIVCIAVTVVASGKTQPDQTQSAHITQASATHY